MTFWQGLDPTMQAAIVGVCGTFLTALLALVGLGYQLSEQRKQSNEAIAENERRKLKAAMYEDAVRVIGEMVDASTAFSTPIRILSVQVAYVAEAAAQGGSFIPPRANIDDLFELSRQVQEAVVRFMFLVEERRFIDPRLLVFRTAMNSASYDVRQVMDGNLWVQLVDLVQRQLPDGNWSQYSVPSVETAEQFKANCEKLLSALDDMTAYCEDFLVELQNALLGDLFGHRVTHRVPLDPNFKVISLANIDALEHWFENSTEWGKHRNQVMKETARSLSQGEEAGIR